MQMPSVKNKGLALVAIVNLIVYIVLLVLLFDSSGSWDFRLILAVLAALTYLFTGIVCSLGLIQRIRWTWYLAMIMWAIECIVFLMIVFWGVDGVYLFVSFAVLRVASIAYLAIGRVRETFDL